MDDTSDPSGSSQQEDSNVEDRGTSNASVSSFQAPPPSRPTDDTVINKRKPFGEAVASLPARDLEKAKQLVGSVLQHYALDQLIGYGGMGVVFRATDIRLNRTVAVKVLTYREGKNEEIIRRFQQEAQSAAQLGHENIAQVYDVGEADDWNFIAFEYVDGPNIRDMVTDEGPLAVDTAIGFVMQTAEALNHANYRDVVHRDVKPSNLIVTPEGQVKLVDMGLARLRDVESDDQDLTESGMTLGTFDYISPEQAQDPRAADIRSDLYSLGCSLYFMLTGRPPFPPGTAAQKLLHHANEVPPDPREIRNDVPDGLAQVLFKLLAKNPAERFQNPRELIQSLQIVADDENIDIYGSTYTRAESLVPPTPSWLTRQIPWLVPVSILLVTVLAIGGFPWQAQSNHVIPPFVAPAQVKMPNSPLEPAESDLPAGSQSNSTTADGVSDGSQRPNVADNLPDGDPRNAGSTDISPRVNPSDIVSSEDNEIRRIIVLDDTTAERRISPPRDTKLVGSLDDALGLIGLPNVREIELRIPAMELTTPLILGDRNLTITAGEDYSPVIRVRSSSWHVAATTEGSNQPLDRAEAPSEFDFAVVRLNGGSMRLQGVVLLLGPESDNTIQSVFELSNGAQVELRDCWLRSEISSNGHQPPALFQITAPNSATMEQPSVRITDCVVHGDINIVRAEVGTPFELDWSNGFLASSARFLELGGATRPMAVDEVVSLRLDHITAAVERGLARFESTVTAPELVGIDIECTNCIFVGSTRHPLFEQVAYNFAVDRLDDFFRFRGRRNFYENTSILWRKIIRDQHDSEQESVRSLKFTDWRNYWTLDEEFSRSEAVQWQQRFIEVAPTPTHMLIPEDFALSRLPGNPARLMHGGTERASAGMDLDDLPQMPLLTAEP